jgi:5'-nucleotidase
VLAPNRNWSVSSHTKTLHRPLWVNTTELADGSPALTTDGSPSDCVALALLGVVERPIDIVVSGINTTHNLGHDVTYSGTVAAAMEAAISRIPAVAISTLYDAEIGYGPAAEIGLQVVRQVVARGLPRYTVLNVNVPCTPLVKVKGFKITGMGMSAYHQDELVQRKDPHGETCYWIEGEALSGVSENGTDITAVAENWVSVTPLQLDMTSYSTMEKLQDWDLNTDVN